MKPNILSILAASLAGVIAMAGCSEADHRAWREPTGEDDFSARCAVKLVPEDMVPTGAYVLALNRTAWEENATLLKDALEEVMASNVSLPYDFGGECEDGYRAEVEWMIAQYETDPNARTTETRPGQHKFFFSLDRGGETAHMSVLASYYGYDRYPT